MAVWMNYNYKILEIIIREICLKPALIRVIGIWILLFEIFHLRQYYKNQTGPDSLLSKKRLC
jgi:hypothetical protein